MFFTCLGAYIILNDPVALLGIGEKLMTLGERIRHLREAINLSQAELAKRIGMKREYLSRLENGGLDNPTIKTLRRLAKGLRIELAALLIDNP